MLACTFALVCLSLFFNNIATVGRSDFPMRSSHGTGPPASRPMNGSVDASRSLPSRMLSSHSAIRQSRADDGGIGSDRGRSLTGERIQSSSVAARGVRASRSALVHSPVEGAGQQLARGAARPTGTVRQSRGEVGGFHRNGLIHSTRGSLVQEPVLSQLPSNVPQGISPFAAASAARVALQTGGLGRPAVSTFQDLTHTPVGGSRATRGLSQNEVEGPEHPQPGSANFISSRHSSSQRLERARSAVYSSGQGSPGVAHPLDSSRPASVWGQTLGFSGVQSRREYPGGVNRNMNNSRAAGATHSNRRGPFLSSPVAGPTLSAADSRGAEEEIGNSSSGGFGGDGQGTLFNGFLSENVATRVQRALAAGIGSILSAVASPISASLGGTVTAGASPMPASLGGHMRGEQVSSRSIPASLDEYQEHFRRVFVGPRSTFIVCGTISSGTHSARAAARDLGSLVDELDSAFRISPLEAFEAPLRRVRPGGDVFDVSDDLVQFLVGADEPVSVPLSQIVEARDLCNSLERHATRWVFESAKSEVSPMGDFQENSPTQATTSSSRNAAGSGGSATALEEAALWWSNPFFCAYLCACAGALKAWVALLDGVVVIA
ncbi:hypothetical protein Emag_004927 [Eimeria magna]